MSSANLVDTFEHIRCALAFTTERYCSLLHLTSNEYSKVLSGRMSIPQETIEKLAEQLDLCPQAILEGKVDFRVLTAHFSGSPNTLPEKYSSAAYTKVRTSAHLIDSLERRNGWRVVQSILRKLQVNRSIFLNPDQEINIQLGVDLCAWIQSRLGPDVLFEMGKNSVNANFHSDLGVILQKMESPMDLYERTFPDLANSYYDQYYRYRLMKLTATQCTIQATRNPLVVEKLKTTHFGSTGTCEQKRGVIAAYPKYKGLPCAKVVEILCVHRGDPYCTFFVDYAEASQLHQKYGL